MDGSQVVVAQTSKESRVHLLPMGLLGLAALAVLLLGASWMYGWFPFAGAPISNEPKPYAPSAAVLRDLESAGPTAVGQPISKEAQKDLQSSGSAAVGASVPPEVVRDLESAVQNDPAF